MVTINDTKTMQHLQIVLEQKRLAITESDIKMDNFTNFIITKKNEIKSCWKMVTVRFNYNSTNVNECYSTLPN